MRSRLITIFISLAIVIFVFVPKTQATHCGGTCGGSTCTDSQTCCFSFDAGGFSYCCSPSDSNPCSHPVDTCDYSPTCTTTLSTSNTNCGATRSTACDGGCTAWSGGTDCTANAVNKVCSSSGTCVRCTSNSDCPSGEFCKNNACLTKICSIASSNPAGCDTDIPNDPLLRCENGEKADCVEECYEQSSWPYGLNYDSSSGKCFECISDSDCPDVCASGGITADYYCSNNQCSFTRNKCPLEGPITPECEGFYCDDRGYYFDPGRSCCTTNFGGPGSTAGKCFDQDNNAYTGHPKIDYSGNLVGDGYLCVKASPETVSGSQWLRVVKTGALTNDFMKISTQTDRIGYQILVSFYDANGNFAAPNSAVWIGIAKYGCTDYSQGSSCWISGCVACAGAENFNKYTLNQEGNSGPICTCGQWDGSECRRMTCETQWQNALGEKGFTADSSWPELVNVATYAYDGKDGFSSGWQTGSKITVSSGGCFIDSQCYDSLGPHTYCDPTYQCKSCSTPGTCQQWSSSTGCGISYSLPGTTCGTNKFCDGNGNCVSCVSEGNSCINNVPCCGSSVCDATTNKCVSCNINKVQTTANIAGTNKCEAACGASSSCDELDANACVDSGGYCTSSCIFQSDGDASSSACGCVADQTSGDSGKAYGIEIFSSDEKICPSESCESNQNCLCFDKSGNKNIKHKAALTTSLCCGDDANEYYKDDSSGGKECTSNINDCVWSTGDAQSSDSGNEGWWCFEGIWASCISSLDIGKKHGTARCVGSGTGWTAGGAGEQDLPENEYSQNACSDGLDNDADGKIDCNDPDCAGTISGNVKDTDNKNIDSAEIEALQETQVKHTAYTNPSGKYNINNVLCGSYDMIASADKYVSETKSITLSPNENKVVDFTLTLGTTCKADCTYAGDELIHKECQGVNGCSFCPDGCSFCDADIAKDSCNFAKPGWIRKYDDPSQQECQATGCVIECGKGCPIAKVVTKAIVTCPEEENLLKVTKLVMYKGKLVKLHVAVCG